MEGLLDNLTALLAAHPLAGGSGIWPLCAFCFRLWPC